MKPRLAGPFVKLYLVSHKDLFQTLHRRSINSNEAFVCKPENPFVAVHMRSVMFGRGHSRPLARTENCRAGWDQLSTKAQRARSRNSPNERTFIGSDRSSRGRPFLLGKAVMSRWDSEPTRKTNPAEAAARDGSVAKSGASLTDEETIQGADELSVPSAR